MNNEKIIAVKNVGKRYGREVVFEDISFDVYKNEIVVILGASGCGKSTLLRIMTGLSKASAGEVLIEGKNVHSHNLARKIGVLFQHNALFGSMTIGDNVALPIAEYTELDKRHIQKIVGMKLAVVGLSGFENYLPSEISGGMKKKAALARALALNPPLLFLDEPTSGLDPISSAELDRLILHINSTSGTTMVVVTHDLASTFAITRKVIMLDKRRKGKIAEGTPDFLKNDCPDPFVRQFFNRQAGAAKQADKI